MKAKRRDEGRVEWSGRMMSGAVADDFSRSLLLLQCRASWRGMSRPDTITIMITITSHNNTS